MARLFYYADRLNPLAGKAFARCRLNFSNPFHNNIAQAIEILHYLEEAVFVLDAVKDDNLVDAVVRRDRVRKKALDAGGDWPKRGVSAIEAPRGLLFHEVKVDDQGRIVYYNIIPPTVLNLSALDSEAFLLLKTYQDESDSRKTELLEELIRAMDPCITCAVH